MNRSKKRAETSKTPPLANKEIVDTTKALIELYKSAFGSQWADVFIATVRTSLPS
jgi:hypothetical protein